MRRTAGGCYEIAGRQLRTLGDVPPESVALATWRERQADLCAESASIARMHRHLTGEEIGLWNVMSAELQVIQAAIGQLESHATLRPGS